MTGKCKICNNLKNDWCEKVLDSPDPDMVRDCRYFLHMTNADRIRAMSDEELGVFLCGIAATNCCGACMVQEYCYAEHNGFADWLRQPVKGGDNDGE